MNTIERIMDEIEDATRQLLADVGTAWQELSSDMHSASIVRFLRPGAILRCLDSNGLWRYGIYTGFENIVTTDRSGINTEFTFSDFLEDAKADELWAAARNSIAVGSREIARNAHRQLGQGHWEMASETLVRMCLSWQGETVDQLIERQFGPFVWQKVELFPF